MIVKNDSIGVKNNAFRKVRPILITVKRNLRTKKIMLLSVNSL